MDTVTSVTNECEMRGRLVLVVMLNGQCMLVHSVWRDKAEGLRCALCLV